MSDYHWLSLRRMSDKIWFLLLVGVGCAGLFSFTPPFAFLLMSVFVGILLGMAEVLHALRRRWPQRIAIFVLIMLAASARDSFLPVHDFWDSLSIASLFLALALGTGFLVVEFKERIKRPRKSANQAAQSTTPSVTPSAGQEARQP